MAHPIKNTDYTEEAARRVAGKRKKKANQADLVRRAIARWKAGKGGVKTQMRLQAAGFNWANRNPGHPDPQRTAKPPTAGFDNPGSQLDPRTLAALMEPVLSRRKRRG